MCGCIDWIKCHFPFMCICVLSHMSHSRSCVNRYLMLTLCMRVCGSAHKLPFIYASLTAYSCLLVYICTLIQPTIILKCYMYVYVYVYVCMYAYTHVYMHACTHVQMHPALPVVCRGIYFRKNGRVLPDLKAMKAYFYILMTVAKFVDTLPRGRPMVFFRTYSPSHYECVQEP